jgi:hypothetical protein
LIEIFTEERPDGGRKVFWPDDGYSILSYPNWYSFNAELSIGEETFYYNTSGTFSGERKLLNNWDALIVTRIILESHIEFRVYEGKKYEMYTLNENGSRRWLVDEKGNILAQFRSRFSWKEFWVVNTIWSDGEFLSTLKGKQLLLLCIHHYFTNK